VEIINHHQLALNESFTLGSEARQNVLNSGLRGMEKLREMSEKKLTEMTWDGSDIKITAEDLDWDYVKMLPDMLPKLRNEFAHGSTELNNWALRSIQIVCEIINQLYQPPA
jgi:hypothetical protein